MQVIQIVSRLIFHSSDTLDLVNRIQSSLIIKLQVYKSSQAYKRMWTQELSEGGLSFVYRIYCT